jgi:hypothetical protein
MYSGKKPHPHDVEDAAEASSSRASPYRVMLSPFLDHGFFSSGLAGVAGGVAGFISPPPGFAGAAAEGGVVAGGVEGAGVSSVQPATNTVASATPESIAKARFPNVIFTGALLRISTQRANHLVLNPS